jgi:hypothetical protein
VFANSKPEGKENKEKTAVLQYVFSNSNVQSVLDIKSLAIHQLPKKQLPYDCTSEKKHIFTGYRLY